MQPPTVRNSEKTTDLLQDLPMPRSISLHSSLSTPAPSFSASSRPLAHSFRFKTWPFSSDKKQQPKPQSSTPDRSYLIDSHNTMDNIADQFLSNVIPSARRNNIVLRNLPSLFHLNRTCCLSVKNLPVEVVLNRIGNFLRLHSITATTPTDGDDDDETTGVFNDEQSGNDDEESTHSCRLYCQTPRMLRFSITLWKNRDTCEMKSGSDIVVEVQRRQGCAIEMQAIRRQLFRAITTGSTTQGDSHSHTYSMMSCCGSRPSRNSFPPNNLHPKKQETVTKDNLQQNTKVSTVGYDYSRCPCGNNCRCNVEDIQIVEDLLGSSCEDQNRLGMESLMSLTNPTAVDPATARCVSTQLLNVCSNAASPNVNTLLQDVFLFHFQKTFQESLQQDYCRGGKDDRNYCYYKGLYSCRVAAAINNDILEGDSASTVMHMLALRVLTNALHVLKTSSPSNRITVSELKASRLWRIILQGLCYNLTRAVRRPQEAALSAKCLNLLSEWTAVAQDQLILCMCTESQQPEEQLLPCLMQAYTYGKAHHLQLEQESQTLIQRLCGESLHHDSVH